MTTLKTIYDIATALQFITNTDKSKKANSFTVNTILINIYLVFDWQSKKLFSLSQAKVGWKAKRSGVEYISATWVASRPRRNLRMLCQWWHQRSSIPFRRSWCIRFASFFSNPEAAWEQHCMIMKFLCYLCMFFSNRSSLQKNWEKVNISPIL